MSVPVNIFQEKGSIHVTCPKRMGGYLKEELLALNFPIITEMPAGIETRGTAEDCILLNLSLRTGHRVLYFIKKFTAKNPDELYRQINKIAWEDYLLEEVYFSIVSHVENETINNSTFASLKCKDGIVDRMTQLFGKRPNTGPDKSFAVIYLHWKNEDASVYIDTSGENIAKHGYRKLPYKAPLQETLAAAMIMASKWDKESNFINPMCGSGTLAIEAALAVTDRVPGLHRSNYGFMHVKGYEETMYLEIRSRVKALVKKSPDIRIIASDIHPLAIEAAKKNAATAGVEQLIEFYTCDFPETPVPDGGGVVMLNPEYGERLGEETELENVYTAIGDFFKQNCKGYIGYVFTGNLNLAKKIGLKTKRKIEFYNSTIDCRLLEYELYAGSKKQVRTDENNSQL